MTDREQAMGNAVNGWTDCESLGGEHAWSVWAPDPESPQSFEWRTCLLCGETALRDSQAGPV